MASEFLSLHDFTIQRHAEVGACGSAGSFRALRRCDGLPVLLHRFRPAGTLIDQAPNLSTTDPPDFTRPFLSRFTGVIVAAGSAYLVEPLPVSAALEDAWRSVLLESPSQCVGFLRAMLAQVTTALTPLVNLGVRHGAVCLGNLVLTTQATYGVLAGHVDSANGPIVVRPADGAVAAQDDLMALSDLPSRLIEIETSMARARGQSLLSDRERHHVEELGLALRAIRACLRCRDNDHVDLARGRSMCGLADGP